MIRALLERFWFGAARPGREMFSRPSEEWERARPLIRFFYCALFFFACRNFETSLDRFDAMGLDPLWPLYWFRWTGGYWGLRATVLLFLFGGLLASWRPDMRAFRILAFLGVLAGMALDNSFGKINNHLHLWASVAFLFVFLPGPSGYREGRPETSAGAVRVFWGAQALVMLTYSMSGAAKLMGAAVQLARGDAYHLFSPEALARHIAERLLQTSERSLAGAWLIENPYWGWPLFMAAIYLETFALWAAFRPSLHRYWSMGLIAMHLGIMLTMNVTFSHSMLLLALLFFASPFASRTFSFRERLWEWPVFGPFLRAFGDAFRNGAPGGAAARAAGGKMETIVFYDGSCGVCSRLIALLLERRIPPDLRFAGLGGQRHAGLVSEHPSLRGMDALIVLRRDGEGESVLVRSEAVFWLLARLPGWTRPALLANLLPMAVLDLGYLAFAAIRHRLDGGRSACPLIAEEHAGLFIDAAEPQAPAVSR